MKNLPAPRLPNPPEEYRRSYFDALSRTLNNFFGLLVEPPLWETAIFATRTITASEEINLNDGLVLVDTTAGNVTVTLPAVTLVENGRVFIVKRTTAGANTLTVACADSATIDGATTQSIATQWHARQFRTDGSNWYLIATYP